MNAAANMLRSVLNPSRAAMSSGIPKRPLRNTQPWRLFGEPLNKTITISQDGVCTSGLIVRPHAAQIAFVDNIHMGACVRKLVDILHAEAAEGARAPSLDSIFVRTSAEEPGADGAAAEVPTLVPLTPEEQQLAEALVSNLVLGAQKSNASSPAGSCVDSRTGSRRISRRASQEQMDHCVRQLSMAA